MSQLPAPTLKSPPSRRGTPSSNDPIPFFHGQGVADGGGSSAPHPSASFQRTMTDQTNYRQQQYWPPTQYHQPTFGQIPQREVPPRCATGPAVEHPYQSYGYAYNAAPVTAPAMDPYRSASVVYSGTPFAYQAVQASTAAGLIPADGATFFEQLASTAEPSLVPEGNLTSSVGNVAGSTSGYYAAQYAKQPAQISAGGSVGIYDDGVAAELAAYSGDVSVPATNIATTDDATPSGVVYDESVGQYYDTNSGQYYDDSTGAWYYPQLASTSATDTHTLGAAVAPETTASHSAVLEPVGDVDGAAFFDNLSTAVVEDSYPAAPQVPSLPDSDYMPVVGTAVEPPHQESTEQAARISRSSLDDIPALAPNSHPLLGLETSLYAAGQQELEQDASNALLSVQSAQTTIDTSNTDLAPVQGYCSGGNTSSGVGTIAGLEPYAYQLTADALMDPEAAYHADLNYEGSAAQISYDTSEKSSPPVVDEANSAGVLTGEIHADATELTAISPHENGAALAATSDATVAAAPALVDMAPAISDRDSAAPSQPYADHYALPGDMYSSELVSHIQHAAQPLPNVSLSSQTLEADLPSANSAGEHAVPQEFGFSGSGATSETMGRSIAAVSRPSLPTPSLSTNWSLLAEHDSASSVVDTVVEAHMSDAVTTSATEGSQTNDMPAVDPYAATYDESSSFYYSQQYDDHHHRQMSAAAIASVATAEVGYEPLDVQYTQDGHHATGTEFVTEYPAYDGATVFGEGFEADGAPVTMAQFQQATTHVAYADSNGYASYDSYTGAYVSGPVDVAHGEYGMNAHHSDQGTYIEQRAPAEQYGADPYMAHEGAPSNEFQAGVQFDHAAYGVPMAVTGGLNQHSYRTASSLSGPALPPHPALFDFQSHSERTSTDISFYDRDAPAGAAAAATVVADTAEYEQQLGSGVHDPLGRLGACRPVVSFGFGGRLVTMFPRQVQRFNMYDSGKASKVAAGMLQISQLADHMRANHFVHNTPLLTGETSRAALLKRRDVAVACAKAWLSSTPQVGLPNQDEQALCGVLIAVLSSFGSSDVSQSEFSAVVEALQPLVAKNTLAVDGEDISGEAPPISHGSKDQLDGLEALLLKGKRIDAIDTACAQGLWTHALIIASCTGKQHWQSVVTAYTSSILQGGHSTLGIQYRMFSGLGAEALDAPRLRHANELSANPSEEFVTAADIGGSAGAKINGYGGHSGGVFADSRPDGSSGDHATADWARILSLMLANRTPGDQAAILKLGDRLRDNGQALAAHICYALTLQSKDIFLPESPETQPRAILLGANEMVRSRTSGSAFEMAHTRYTRYYRDSSAIFLTELYEVAFALKTAANSDAQLAGTSAGAPNGTGASANVGSGAGNANVTRPTMLLCLPHLQAYKLYHAWWLVDCGQAALASRYCDSVLGILATLPQGVPVPYIHASLVQELRNLRDRLSGSGMTSIKAAEIVGDDAAVSSAGSKSWLARAMPRPSFTSLMSAFDSSIDKFITGADGNRISLESNTLSGKYEIGPDRTPQQQNHEPEQPAGPLRPLGAVSWEGRTPSPRILPANTTNGASEAASRYSDTYVPVFGSPRQSLDGRPSGLGARDGSFSGRGSVPPRMYTPSNNSQLADQMTRDFSQLTTQPVSQPQWGDPASGSYGAYQGECAAPRASFGDGSRVSAPSMSYGGEAAGTIAAPPAHSESAIVDDEEEDMFGFSRKQPSAKPDQGSARPSADAARGTAAMASSSRTSGDANNEKTSGKGDAQGDAKGGNGVLGILKSFWGGRKNQANLGEESNFVYDPVQKRWVDKNASAEQQDIGPPPPPPPSVMRFQPQSSSVPPPASAGMHQQHSMPGVAYGSAATAGSSPLGMDGSMAPIFRGRLHSETIPPAAASSDLSRVGSPASSISAMGASGTPPASAGGRGGKRRAARTKYVDLLNQ